MWRVLLGEMYERNIISSTPSLVALNVVLRPTIFTFLTKGMSVQIAMDGRELSEARDEHTNEQTLSSSLNEDPFQ